MYQGFYQFSSNPFAAPADAQQIFMAGSHRDALSGVLLDILKCRRFVAVAGTGEVGKTTVLNAALASLADSRRNRPVRVTRLETERLDRLTAHGIVGQVLGIQPDRLTDADLERLPRTIMRDRDAESQHVLVVDNAPLLTPAAMELLHLVSGIRTQGVPFLQIILAGRDDLWTTLQNNKPWLTDRAVSRSDVEPLEETEVRQYIDYRLRCAGNSIQQVMTDAALADVVSHGRALPGRINRILDRAFTIGAAQGRLRVTPEVIEQAIVGLPSASRLPPRSAETDQPQPSIFRPRLPAGEDDAPLGAPGMSATYRPITVSRAVVWSATGLLGAAAMVALALGLTAGGTHPKAAVETIVAEAPQPSSLAPANSANGAVAASEKGAPDAETAMQGTPAEQPAATAPAAVSTGAPDVETAMQSAPVEQPAATAPAAVSTDAPDVETAMQGAPVEQAAATAPAAVSTGAPDMETATRGAPAEQPTATAPAAGSSALPVTVADAPAGDAAVEQPEPEPPRATVAETVQPDPTATEPPARVAPLASKVPATAPTHEPPDVLAALLQRGAAMLAAGDVTAARLLYERAAAAGSAPAALEVGKTYDPVFLAKISAVGLRGDPMMATDWYTRAHVLGDPDAAALLRQPEASGSTAR